MANYKKFLYASNGGGTLDGTTYATEAEKWAYIITQASAQNGKWYKTLIFREATNEIYNRGKAYGLSSADASRISALETWKMGLNVVAQLLNGYAVAQTYGQVASSDDIKTAFGKIQKGINDIKAEIGQKAVANTAGQGEPSNAVSATGIYKEIEDGIANTIARIVANADADFDTLKEVADWIKSDVSGAALMQTQIATLVADANTNGSVAKAKADAQSYADGLINALDLASNHANAVATDSNGYVTTAISQTNGFVKNESVTVTYGTFANGAQVNANKGIATVEGVKAYVDGSLALANSSLQSIVLGDLTINSSSNGDLLPSLMTEISYIDFMDGDIHMGYVAFSENSIYADSFDTLGENETQLVEVAIDGTLDDFEVYVTVTTATIASQGEGNPTDGLALASDVYAYVNEVKESWSQSLISTEKVLALALKDHEDRIAETEEWVEW